MGVRPRHTDEQRKAFIDAYIAGTETLVSVAKRLGTSAPYISALAARAGVQRRHSGSKRAKIIAAYQVRPDRSLSAIAREFNSTKGYVVAVLRECGFPVASDADLGRAAREAGLTLADIYALAEKRRAA